MKKFLALALLSAASTLSAATVTWTCTTTGSLQGLAGQSASNTVSPTCSTADPLPAGPGLTFTNLQLNWSLDFTFNSFDAGTKSTVWAINSLGTNLDQSGLTVDNLGGPNQRPRVGSVSTSDAGDLALYAALGIGNVPVAVGAISYVGASTAVTGGTADLQYILTYRVDTGVPEPATLAMFGAGLLALGLFRRK